MASELKSLLEELGYLSLLTQRRNEVRGHVEHQPSNTSQSARLEWTVDQDVMTLPEVHSEIFEAFDFNWQMVLFPNDFDTPTVSLFLSVVDPQRSRKTSFRLSMINQFVDTLTVSRDIQHEFSAATPDRGVLCFADRVDILETDNGFVVDEKFIIQVVISAEDSAL